MNNNQISFEEIKEFYLVVHGISIPDMEIPKKLSSYDFQMIKVNTVSTTTMVDVSKSMFGKTVEVPSFRINNIPSGGLPRTKKVAPEDTYSVFGFNAISNFKVLSNEQRKYFHVQSGTKYVGKIKEYMTFIDYLLLLQISFFLKRDILILPKEATIVTSQTNSMGNLALVEPYQKNSKIIRVHMRAPNLFGPEYLFLPKEEISLNLCVPC